MSRWIDEFDELDKEKTLRAVLQVAEHLSAYEHRDGREISWDVIPGKETDPGAVLVSDVSLYGGAAGIALFFLRLYEVTKDAAYLDKAKGGIDFCYRKRRSQKELADQGEGTLKGIPGGLYNGPAGCAYVAYEIHEKTRDEAFLGYAKEIADDVAGAAEYDSDGAFFSGVGGILSDGGLFLFLIWIYEKSHDKKYLDVAVSGMERILKNADDAPSGSRWLNMDSVAFGLGEKGYFPGFFYGTAGTGFLLAKIFEITKDEKFLDGARKAADYIKSIADITPDSEAALIGYNDPYRKDMHYLGLCQGPIGTSRLFYQLYRVTGEDEYLSWVLKLTNGVLRACAPKIHSKGYWHTYNYCCGTAGMLEHFIEIHNLTGDEKYLRAAEEAAVKLIGDSVSEDDKRCWYSAWNRHAPNEVENWTGLYVGSSGEASALLTYYNYLSDNREISGYPEDPYHSA